MCCAACKGLQGRCNSLSLPLKSACCRPVGASCSAAPCSPHPPPACTVQADSPRLQQGQYSVRHWPHCSNLIPSFAAPCNPGAMAPCSPLLIRPPRSAPRPGSNKMVKWELSALCRPLPLGTDKSTACPAFRLLIPKQLQLIFSDHSCAMRYWSNLGPCLANAASQPTAASAAALQQ